MGSKGERRSATLSAGLPWRSTRWQNGGRRSMSRFAGHTLGLLIAAITANVT